MRRQGYGPTAAFFVVGVLVIACATGAAEDQDASVGVGGGSDGGATTPDAGLDAPARRDATIGIPIGGGDGGGSPSDAGGDDGAEDGDGESSSSMTSGSGAESTSTSTGGSATSTTTTSTPVTSTSLVSTSSIAMTSSSPTSACTVVAPVSAGGGASSCPAPVSGMCGSAGTAGFSPTSPPPNPAANVCAPGEVTQIYNDCLGGGTCPESSASSSGFACFSCLFSEASAPSWGAAVLSSNGVVSPNFGGCLLLLEPCNTACASNFEAVVECEQAACAANCPVSTEASFNAYSTCANTVDTCDPDGCAAFVDATECASEVTGAAHPGAVCFSSPTNFEATFLAIGPVFCGGS